MVVVAEMPLQPGPQNYGTLDDSPTVMLPTVPPPAEQAILDAAREQIDAAHVEGEYIWAPGDPSQTIVAVARKGTPRSSSSATITTAGSAASSAATPRTR